MQRFMKPGVIEFKTNTTQRLKLETGHVNQALQLLFSYLITEGAQAPETKHFFPNILAVIREIVIRINDKDDVLRLTGAELMAIYIADHGQRPSMTKNVLRGTQQDDVFTISHWATNTEHLALTAHDYRRADKVELQITWGDTGSIWESPNGAEFTNFECEVVQQAVDSYQAPLTGAINQTTKAPRRYNPAIRYFPRSTESFTSPKNLTKLGTVEKTPGNPFWCKGLIMFASVEGRVNDITAYLGGDIELRQGDETLATVPITALQAAQEIAKGLEPDADVLYIPFSGLFRSVEIERMHLWKKDLEIYGNVVFADDEPTVITTLADAYRQERLK